MDEKIFKDFEVVGVYLDQFVEGDAWKIGCVAGRDKRRRMTGFHEDFRDRSHE